MISKINVDMAEFHHKRLRERYLRERVWTVKADLWSKGDYKNLTVIEAYYRETVGEKDE